MEKMGAAVKSLLVVNAIIFAATYLVTGWLQPLWELLALAFPLHPQFGVWQFVTHAFLHANPLHLFFNMFALFSFGLIFERLWGVGRFLIFYFACAIGAGLIYTAVNWYEFHAMAQQLGALGMDESRLARLLVSREYDTQLLDPESRALQEAVVGLFESRVVGASGAIYGILVAFGFTFPRAQLSLIFLPIPIQARFFIPALIGLDLFFGVTGYSMFGLSIAHFAHIGGALIGFLLMLYWNRALKRRPRFEGPWEADQ